MQFADIINTLFALGTIAAQVGIVVLAIFLITEKPAALGDLMRSRGVLLAWLFALAAMLGSLIYSEIIGYEPCKLCWIQRILMYPQVLILGLALWGKHKGSHALLDSALVLALIGFAVGVYHILLQWGLVPELPCAAVGYGVSCAQNFVLSLGYITIPLMSATAFLFISLALLSSRRHNSRP